MHDIDCRVYQLYHCAYEKTHEKNRNDAGALSLLICFNLSPSLPLSRSPHCALSLLLSRTKVKLNSNLDITGTQNYYNRMEHAPRIQMKRYELVIFRARS